MEGRGEEAQRLEADLLSHSSAQEGFVGGYRLTARDGGREIGRITIWESEEAADRAATTRHVMALRSEPLAVAEAERVEMASDAVRPG